MTNYKIGDRVEAIDDVVVGVIRKINANQITVESVEGFEIIYAPSELVLVSNSRSIKVSNFDVAQIKSEKETPKRRNVQSRK